MTPKRANQMAFKWLTLHGQHAKDCKRTRWRIMAQGGGKYAVEKELAKVDCTCGLDDTKNALHQVASQ